MKILLDHIENKLHFEGCSHCGTKKVTYFNNEKNNIVEDFLFSIVYELTEFENNSTLEACDKCIPKKYKKIFSFNKAFYLYP